MKLPQEYPEIIAAGSRALQALEMRTRDQAARQPEDPVLWLTIRDIAGLALRLEGLNDWEWRTGFAELSITGQDLGVLDELASNAGGTSTLDASVATAEDRESLRRLRTFLGAYCDRAFEFDDPAVAGPTPGAPAV